MLFTTPKNPEEEKEMKDYMNKHPYATFNEPTKQEIEQAKLDLQSIKEARANIKKV